MMVIRAFILFLAFMIAGCGVEQGQPVQLHEPARTATEEAPKPIKGTWTEYLKARDAELSQLDQKDIRRFILELADLALDVDRLKSAAHRADEALLAELTLLNRLILKVSTADQALDDLLGRYGQILQSGCESSMRNCAHLTYLKKVPFTSTVVEKILTVKRLAQGNELTLFSIAFALHNREVPSSLMLSFTEELQRQLRSSSDVVKGGADKWIHFASTLAFSSGRSLSQYELQRLVRAFAPLSTETRTRMAQAGAPLSPWLTLAVQSGLLQDRAYLGKVIKDEVAILEKNDDGTVRRSQSLKLRYPKVWQAFSMRDLEESSLAFWLAESVFLGRLSSESAKTIWTGAKLSEDDLWRATEGILRIQFLYTLLKSHERAREKMLRTDVSSDELLRQALEGGLVVRPLWTNYSRQVGQVKAFVSGSLPASSAPDSAYQKALAVFDGLPHEIKTMATYPHMIVAAYFFSKKDAEIRFRGPFGYVTVSSTEIMDELFRGNFRPWFDYSEDGRRLNSFEIISAFDAAVRAGLLTQFGIDPYEFILEMHQRMTREPVNEIQGIHDQLKSRFTSSEFSDLLRDCQSLGQAGGSRPSWSTPIGELSRYPLRGSTRIESIFQDLGSGGRSSHSDAKAVSKRTKGFFLMDELVAEGVEVHRLDLWIVHLLLDSMKHSVDGLSRSQSPSQSQKKLMLAIESERDVGAQFMGLVSQVFDGVKDCYQQIALDELKASRRLAQMEVAYLRQVHRDLKRVRLNQQDGGVMTPIKFSDLPGGFAGLDLLSNEGYWYHSSDVFLRLRQYLKSGLVTEADRFAPVAPHVVVHVGERLNSRHPLVRDTKKVLLRYTDSEDQFVEQGLRTLFHSGEGWLRWYSIANSDALITWAGYIHSLVGLYRSGEVSLYPAHCLHQICRPEEKVKQKVADVNDVIRVHAGYLKLTELNEFDRWVMSTAGLFRKFDPMAFSHILLKYSKDADTYGNISALFGLFDYVIENGMQPALGRTLDALRIRSEVVEGDHMTSSLAERIIRRRKGFLELGQEYYQFKKDGMERASLFKGSSEFLNQLSDRIVGFVSQEVSHIDRLTRVVAQHALDLEQKGVGIRADISLAESIMAPAISSSVVQKSTNQLNHFHRSTGGLFKKSND